MKVQKKPKTTVITALTARTQLGQILQRVGSSRERFLIGRNGQPAAVVMGIDDFLDVVAPAPDWLQQSWAAAEKNGTDRLSMSEIDGEIAGFRRERMKRAKAS